MMKNDMYFPVSFINEIKHSLSKNKKKKKHKDSGMTNYPKSKKRYITVSHAKHNLFVFLIQICLNLLCPFQKSAVHVNFIDIYMVYD